jgi:Zn-finger nucleic acid-binding protein
MNCPACKGPLRQKSAGGMTLDVCYGGCGGIWFDQSELERTDPRASISLHTVWRDPNAKVSLTEPRLCPRCPNQVLERKTFSDFVRVEVDQCPSCAGLWLDEGEFTRVYKSSGNPAMPLWAASIANVAAHPDARRTR